MRQRGERKAKSLGFRKLTNTLTPRENGLFFWILAAFNVFSTLSDPKNGEKT